MSAMETMTEWEQVAITALLKHRFEDGWVYPRGRDDRRLLRRAGRLGFVDADGYLTRTGERFLRTQSSAPLQQFA